MREIAKLKIYLSTQLLHLIIILHLINPSKMKLNTVLTIVIFSLLGFALADSNIPAPGNSLPKDFQPAPPLAKGGHGPETPRDRTTKVETVHPSETKSVDPPKKSETSPLPKTKSLDLPKKSETPDLPKTKTLDLPKKSGTPSPPKTKSQDPAKKSETPHPLKATQSTGEEDAHPTKSVHTTESKKSELAKSSSPQPRVSENPKPSGFTTHHRVTTSSTSHAALHSQPSESLGGITVRFTPVISSFIIGT
jgi:hypothetical protein